MIRGSGRPTVLLTVAATLLLIAVRIDGSSLERGNRRFRDGDVRDAATLFRRHLSDDPGAGAYNAGTAELAIDDPQAESHLLQASVSPDTVIAHRANYNLAFEYLSSIRADLEQDSAIALARAAIRHSRSALRLDPTREEARWNLALAQMRLDSLTQLRVQRNDVSSPGQDDTPIDLESMTRGAGEARSGVEPENARAGEVLGQRLAAAQGAREAWATRDPGPLTERDARDLLANVVHDPEQLVRGLMWSHRPEVQWWNSEPYPGGDW